MAKFVIVLEVVKVRASEFLVVLIPDLLRERVRYLLESLVCNFLMASEGCRIFALILTFYR